MKLKAIICDVLLDSFNFWKPFSSHDIDIETIDSNNHEHPEKIKLLLQEKIDSLEVSSIKYDFILLGYGLCGKALEGLHSRNTPIVIPRAHDCITLFLGSKEKYNDYFINNPGTMFYIAAWIDRNGIANTRKDLSSLGLFSDRKLYEGKYGEEEVEYLVNLSEAWTQNYNRALYISSLLSKTDYFSEIKKIACKNRWDYESIAENTLMIKDFVCGNWKEESFLIVPKSSSIYHKTDDSIMCSVFSDRNTD